MKTMKELIEQRVFDNGVDNEVIFPNKLRQSGIEDIKNYRKELHFDVSMSTDRITLNGKEISFKKYQELSYQHYLKLQSNLPKIEYIKEKFNLTEDDLK